VRGLRKALPIRRSGRQQAPSLSRLHAEYRALSHESGRLYLSQLGPGAEDIPNVE
jgi:hypothetical protein